MWKFAASACLAVALSIVAASPTLAFGDGCGDRAIECYDKVRLPDVYATRARPVLVSPGWREVVPTPALYGRYTTPVEVRPGRWRWTMTPPVYGTRLQRVVVAPASRTYDAIPPVTRRVGQTVVVSRGGVRWERRRDLFGRERLCKVVGSPETRTVVREVIVSPARRIARRTAPVYGAVAVPVLIRPAVLNAFTSRRFVRCTAGRSWSGPPPWACSIIRRLLAWLARPCSFEPVGTPGRGHAQVFDR